MIGEIDPETEIAKLEYRLEKLSVLENARATF
jgi:hypothetical protein